MFWIPKFSYHSNTHVPIIFLLIPIYASFLLCICPSLIYISLCNLPTYLQLSILCVSISPAIHLSSFLFLSFFVSVHHPASISFYLSLYVIRRPRFNLWVRKIPWRRKRPPTPGLLPGKRSLARLQSTELQKNWTQLSWLIHLSIYLWPTYLIYLPTSVHPSCIYLTMSFFLFPSIYLSIIYPNCLSHLSSIYIYPPTDMYPSPIYHLSTSEWLIHLSIYLWPTYLIYLHLSIHHAYI